MPTVDYIVVGSGCSGAMAAQTLVEAGADVMMLDVGYQPKAAAAPDQDYLDLRRSDPQQYRYLVGERFEGIPWGKVGKSEQITPPRQHIFAEVDRLLPVISQQFSPFESLGYGGLGIGWGLGCWQFSEVELTAAGLDAGRMPAAYNLVASRIGISGSRDDAAAYTLGNLKPLQPATQLDRNHQRLHANYVRRQSRLAGSGFIMGRTPLALLTQPLGQRQPYAYHDMDYYSDSGESAWRPWMTIEALKQRPNFSYVSDQLVQRFVEHGRYSEVSCLQADSGQPTTYRCRKLILATSALGSARIALRSLRQPTRLPLLCNPYSYIPCIQPALVGRAAESRKLGFAQLSLFLDEAGDQRDVSMASLYGYQSLMLFRLLKQVPLNLPDASAIMQYLLSGIIIMGLHQPDRPGAGKYVELVPDAGSPTGDALQAFYQPSAAEQAERRRREKKYIVAMRQLGAYALRRIDPGYGASIHYAGTLPFSASNDAGTLSPRGKLGGTSNVYVADSSGFTYLPAKGLTFSLLANAHLTAQNALHDD